MEADATARPDAASAAVVARLHKHPVEVTGAETETTRRWANPDGTTTDEVYAGPVRARRGTDWVPIDTTLVVANGAVRANATIGDVTFSAGGDTKLASVTGNGVSVGMTWPQPLPAPTIAGDTATYAEVLPGVDLRMTAMAAGYEQSFVLKNRAALAHLLRVPLTTSGVEAVTEAGRTSFRDAHGTERAWVDSAVMWDATGRQAPVGVAADSGPSGRGLRMTPNAAFLADRSITFPVVVDPTVQIYRWRDAYISSTATTTNYGSNAYLKIGARSGTTYVSYISFDMSAYAGKKITDVYQWLGTVDSLTCNAKTTSAYQVTTTWNPATVTWASHPTTDLSTALATATSAGGGPTGSSCAANAWMTFHSQALTDQYQAWADDNATNYGLSIRADAADSLAAKDFASGENGSWTPRINITYDNYPGTVAGRFVTPALLGSDNSTRYASSTTPALAGGACDADGEPQRIDFEVWNSTMTTLVQSSSTGQSTVPSCAIKQWTVPTALTNGTTYQWRSRAYDGTVYSKAWSSWSPLVVDTTAPPTAAISATTFSQNTWLNYTNPAPVDEAFTFTASPTTDIAGYYYSLDDPNPKTYTTSASATLNIGEGWHTVYVQTADRAGNRSAVTTYSFGFGYLGVTSPRLGSRSTQSFTLSGIANPSVGTLTWSRLDDATGHWLPLSQLKDGSNNTVTQPITLSGGVVPTLTWDAATELGDNGKGVVQLQGIVTDISAPTVQLSTRAVSVTFDPNDFASVDATEGAGPGTLNLVTGNLQVSATDASLDAYGSDLSVGRTFNTRDQNAQPNGPFGKGWISSAPVTAASSEYTALSVANLSATLTLAGGDTIGFTRSSSTATTFTSEYGHEDLALTYVSASSRYDLKDLDGNVTGFTKPTGATSYVPTTVQQAGDPGSTTYAYETKTIGTDSVTRVTGVLAPDPGTLSAACSLASPTAVVGCRTLKLTYFASSTPVPTGTNIGAYPDRLQKVEAIAYNPATSAMATVSVAQYDYNADGRLADAYDPRLSTLKTVYTYYTNGLLATVTPPAEEAWTIAYAPLSGEGPTVGRVMTISRPSLLASPAPAVATTTYVYRVPVTGSGAPYDLSSAVLDQTGQQDRPTTATAVFPATTSATFGGGSLPSPTSYDHATVHFMNTDGREVNVADANGGVDTTEYDGRGNVVRTLSAGNRAQAIAQGATTAEQAAIAQALSSLTVYSPNGLDVQETFGPEHDVRLTTSTDLVRARAHTVNTYDEGTTGGPFHLLTTTVTSARVAGEATDRTSESRTTKTEYGTSTSQWTLGQPTASIVDAVSTGLNLATRTSYSADGRVLTQTLPAGGTTTNTAATRVTRYYIAGTGSGDTACDSKPQWANLVCSVGPGGQPTGNALPTTYTTYDMFNHPTVLTEKASGTTLRTTTTAYDTAARPVTTDITASTGTALSTLATYYDANGRATETQSKTGSTVTAHVVRTFDTLGRLTSYTDTDGNVSTTTYDVLGRPVTTSDGKGTQTWTYDGGSEKRGLATQLVDSQAGTWTAAYDVDGTPTVDWPNGLRSTSTVDEAGSAAALTYAATSGCTGAACTVLSDSVQESIHGQWLSHDSTLSSQTYTYDAAARLTQVNDTVADACTVRKYTFDTAGAGNSNRTKLETFDSTGACQTTSATATVNSTYDAADRVTTSGTVYDTLGRTTTVPDGDALDAGAVTAAYHVNDLLRSVGIAGGATKTYTLDVDEQRVRSWTDGTTTRTNHFDGDGDNPAWTQEGASTYTRDIGGIGGDLVAIYDSATSSANLQLTNLHGDVVATTTTGSTALATTMEATEFGTPRGATGTRYGWLGGKQRAADTPASLSIMGVRLYNPATGRFLQTDPVYGGNASSYAYPNDPLTQFDLDGRFCIFGTHHGRGRGCRGGRVGRRIRGVGLSGSLCLGYVAAYCGSVSLNFYDGFSASHGPGHGFGWSGPSIGATYQSGPTAGRGDCHSGGFLLVGAGACYGGHRQYNANVGFGTGGYFHTHYRSYSWKPWRYKLHHLSRD